MPRLPASAQGSAADFARRRASYERHGIRVYDADTRQMYAPATYVASPAAARPVLPMLTTQPARRHGEPTEATPDGPAQPVTSRITNARPAPPAVFRSSRHPRSAGAAHKRRPRRMVRVA